VQSGDTAASVSNRYAADSEVLIELNDLPQSGSLAGRDEIFVSKEGGKPPGTGASPSAGQVLAVSAPKARCGVGGRPCLEWPVKGRVSSGFGARSNGHHDGIDIPAARGASVAAAEKGKVLYSGDDIKGYGNLIIMRHDNSIITVYAHNEENLVKEGDTVKRGQSIAKVGDTGSANGVHLHFEVRVDEQPKDPLLYLPPE
jgi:murein DD-endopeptidase MepM/ murein hydrolase activator NlpD